jgi:two-component system, OmpR family, KDP operon response regulator KdpE
VTVEGRPVDLLVVEDEEMNRILLRAVLARSADPRIRDASLTEATTLAAARARIHDPGWPIDVALLDVQLSDGSGLDLIKELAERVPRPKIVVLTAGVLAPQRAEAQEAGCDAFLGKPYMPRELLDTLSTLIAAG